MSENYRVMRTQRHWTKGARLLEAQQKVVQLRRAQNGVLRCQFVVKTRERSRGACVRTQHHGL